MATHGERRKQAHFAVRPVPRDTLPDQIYRQIKDLILDGGIEPGELVTIQSLADAFDVSAMPVREALQRLTTEKALTVVSGRSMGIPELSLEHLEDLRRVRLEIESLAAEWACGNIDADKFGKLVALIGKMDEAAQSGHTHKYVRANREFHFGIYEESGSPSLLAAIERLWLQVSPYFHLLRGSGNYATANKQHKRLLDALRRGNGKAAGGCVRADIEAAAQTLKELLVVRS